MNILDTLTEAIQGTFRIDAATQEKLLVSFAILLVLWLIRLLVLVVVHRRSEDIRIRYRWKKTSQYVMVTLAVVILGTIWIQGFRSLATYLGLLSAGLAIALKELVANFVGWAFIFWRGPSKSETGSRSATLQATSSISGSSSSPSSRSGTGLTRTKALVG